MSKSRRTKQREQIGFMLSVIALVVIVGLLLFGEPTPTRWMLLVAAVVNAATFGFLSRAR